MKTGRTTARLLVAAALGHFRCPATCAASSRMHSGLATNGEFGVAERPLCGLNLRLWPILAVQVGSTNDFRAFYPGETRGIDAQRCEFNSRSM
jgi:hypothetical protein